MDYSAGQKIHTNAVKYFEAWE